MKISKLLVLITIMAVGWIMPTAVSAQVNLSRDSYFGPSSHDKLNNLKAHIANLLEENQRLAREYNELKAEQDDLQSQVDRYAAEIGEITRVTVRRQKTEEMQRKAAHETRDEYEKVKNESLIQQSRNAYLSGALIDFDDKERLLELQLEDLIIKKRELEMQLKLAEFKLNERRRGEEGEINDLRLKLQKILLSDKETQEELSQIERDTKNVYSTVERLKDENQRLEKDLEVLRAQSELKTKEVNLLKSKKMYLTRSLESNLWDKNRERDKLEQRVNHLEDKYEYLKDGLSSSLSSREQSKELLNHIISIDKENQTLREKIDKLEKENYYR